MLSVQCNYLRLHISYKNAYTRILFFNVYDQNIRFYEISSYITSVKFHFSINMSKSSSVVGNERYLGNLF